MYLYYHNDVNHNFGDDVNPWLWPRVFGDVFSGGFFHEESLVDKIEESDSFFIGIGTLLNKGIPDKGKKIVFGSGVGYGEIPNLDRNWDFYFVRGPLSARKLNLSLDLAITDPAIILPDFVDCSVPKTHNFSYMPHCASVRHGEWRKVCDYLGVNFIDPQDSVENVTRDISATSILITEALHGAIVADSLRVPWIPVVTTNQILEFKWLDWCASIGIDYRPMQMASLWKPSNGFVKKIRYAIKLKVVEMQLSSIIKNGKVVLSSDLVAKSNREKIYEKIDLFKRR